MYAILKSEDFSKSSRLRCLRREKADAFPAILRQSDAGCQYDKTTNHKALEDKKR